MNDLVLEGSDKTPHFRLFSNGNLHFGGVSKPADAASFYFNIMDWISDYYRTPNLKTEITINFSELDSRSSSMVLKMFYCFNRLERSGKSSVRCKWYYDDQDENMKRLIEQVMEYADKIYFELHPSKKAFGAQAS